MKLPHMNRYIATMMISILPVVTQNNGNEYAITWDINLGGAVRSGDSLSVTVDDAIALSWSQGHNIYRSVGNCSDFTYDSFINSATTIESQHPGGNMYYLDVPPSGEIYCYACVTHWDTMQFTLHVTDAGLCSDTKVYSCQAALNEWNSMNCCAYQTCLS